MRAQSRHCVAYADRVVVWNAGHVMAAGTPPEVMRNQEVLESVVGIV